MNKKKITRWIWRVPGATRWKEKKEEKMNNLNLSESWEHKKDCDTNEN